MRMIWHRYKYAALLIAVCGAGVFSLATWQEGFPSQAGATTPIGSVTTGRVLYYGDSLAAESARYARANLGPRVQLVDRTYPGTSPCDWMSAARLDRARGNIRAVIIETFGNNISACQKVDGQKVTNGSKAYWHMYEEDLLDLIGEFPSGTPVWLTSAPAAKNDLSGGSSHKARMLALMTKIAESKKNVRVVDAGAAVESPAGSYTPFGLCLSGSPCSNQPRRGWTRWRSLDGLHFCPVITRATISKLRGCPVFATGAKRFGIAQTNPVKSYLDL